MGQTRMLEVPLTEELYNELKARVGEGRHEHMGGEVAQLLEFALRLLDEQGGTRRAFDFDEQFGAGEDFWEDDEDFEQFRQRARQAPMMEVARLARPDGETVRVSFRMPRVLAGWLDERREVLATTPELHAFYGNVDRATTVRHILAQTLLIELPLDATPPSGEDANDTLFIPRGLHDRLEARVADVIAQGGRANAGVSTVIRHVLAAAHADALKHSR